MNFAVICPDGIDRLFACWNTKDEAEGDAGYFSARSSCRDWCYDSGDRGCPGGKHKVMNNSLFFVYPEGV